MAQVLSNYATSLPTPPTSPTKMAVQPGPQGHLGNLSASQEAKLRALWAIAYKFVETCEADDSFKDAVTLEEKFVPPAMKPGAAQRKKANKGRSATRQEHPTLVKELLSLLPNDERSMDKLVSAALDALDYWTPYMFRITLLHTVKQEHPDELALRFLRQSNWDGHARVLGAEFMKLLRSGKGFLHGNDRQNQPITYVRVRLHKAGDESPESMQRYIIYLLEMARLSLRPPVETGTVFLDMSHFRLKNFDLAPLKFILKCAEQYYPECIGLILIHKAPFGTKALWGLIRHWVSAPIANKVKFTKNRKDLFKYIDPSQVLKEHGGLDDFKYEYEEPILDENFKMQNTITRNYLLLERQMLVEQFEDVTKEWVMNAQGTERAAEVSSRRDQVSAQLTANFWELDPYVRARSLYDRRGCLHGTGSLQFHPPKSERRHRDSTTTRARSMSSSSGARSSIIARSAIGYSSSSAMSSGGARSSISGAGSAGTAGTLTTCSILGSPVKEDHYGEMEQIDASILGDNSSYYSD
ncbi:hypothetical protein LLEC1_05802 [Akanthomyces lecanii]|uniref:CRAL-TRIO domain-containing protein n=1 Tax=Cordyceps confragosa TaxID=2714763 RepID=A0A179IBN4_CORDF|nr:hypothetical protein LLEC1_05802 [Akanthomyces lecanii]